MGNDEQKIGTNKRNGKCAVPTLIETDLIRDTNIVAYSHPFVVVDAIAVVLDVLAFAVACGRPNGAVSDPKVLDLVD